jgi:hypothetical protein
MHEEISEGEISSKVIAGPAASAKHALTSERSVILREEVQSETLHYPEDRAPAVVVSERKETSAPYTALERGAPVVDTALQPEEYEAVGGIVGDVSRLKSGRELASRMNSASWSQLAKSREKLAIRRRRESVVRRTTRIGDPGGRTRSTIYRILRPHELVRDGAEFFIGEELRT